MSMHLAMRPTSPILKVFVCLLLTAMIFISIISTPPFAKAQSSQEVTASVNATTLTINGQTSPNAFVTILKDATPIGSVSAGSNGSFSTILPFNGGGIHTINVFSQEVSGRFSDPLSTTISVISNQNTVYFAFLPPTITLSPVIVRPNGTVTISGSTIPFGTITLTTSSGQTAQVMADANGTWQSVVQAPMSGQASIYAVANDNIGRQSQPSRNLFFTVKTDSEQQPVVPLFPIRPQKPAPPLIPIITSPQNNQFLTNRILTVKGVAEPGTVIELRLNGKSIGSAYTSIDAIWQIAYSPSSGQSSLEARACRSSVCSEYSLPITVYANSELLAGSFYSSLDLPLYNIKGMVNRQLFLPLVIRGGAPPYRVSTNWGDGTTSQKSFEVGERPLLTHTYTSSGTYSGTVTISDASNNVHVHSFGLQIERAPYALLSATFITLLCLLLLFLIVLRQIQSRYI